MGRIWKSLPVLWKADHACGNRLQLFSGWGKPHYRWRGKFASTSIWGVFPLWWEHCVGFVGVPAKELRSLGQRKSKQRQLMKSIAGSSSSLQSKWWDWLTSSFNKWRYTWVWEIKRRMNCEEAVAVHTLTALHWEVIKTHIIIQWFWRKHFSSALLINHLLPLFFFSFPSSTIKYCLIKPLPLLTVKKQSLLSAWPLQVEANAAARQSLAEGSKRQILV